MGFYSYGHVMLPVFGVDAIVFHPDDGFVARSVGGTDPQTTPGVFRFPFRIVTVVKCGDVVLHGAEGVAVTREG